jgi:hypothetical protein
MYFFPIRQCVDYFKTGFVTYTKLAVQQQYL